MAIIFEDLPESEQEKVRKKIAEQRKEDWFKMLGEICKGEVKEEEKWEKEAKKVGMGSLTKKSNYNYIINDKGYKELEHRYIWKKKHGNIPKGLMIHHKNGNSKDNRIENLELVSIKHHAERHKELSRIRDNSKKEEEDGKNNTS